MNILLKEKYKSKFDKTESLKNIYFDYCGLERNYNLICKIQPEMTVTSKHVCEKLQLSVA